MVEINSTFILSVETSYRGTCRVAEQVEHTLLWLVERCPALRTCQSWVKDLDKFEITSHAAQPISLLFWLIFGLDPIGANEQESMYLCLLVFPFFFNWWTKTTYSHNRRINSWLGVWPSHSAKVYELSRPHSTARVNRLPQTWCLDGHRIDLERPQVPNSVEIHS